MNRYIDADKLKEAWYTKHNITEEDCGACFVGYSEVPRFIDNAPTADVVEVVRCKDCKWFHRIGCAIEISDKSDAPTDNDYCSFGERADE